MAISKNLKLYITIWSIDSIRSIRRHLSTMTICHSRPLLSRIIIGINRRLCYLISENDDNKICSNIYRSDEKWC